MQGGNNGMEQMKTRHHEACEYEDVITKPITLCSNLKKFIGIFSNIILQHLKYVFGLLLTRLFNFKKTAICIPALSFI